MFAEILPIHIRSTAFPLGLSVMWTANFALTYGTSAMREGAMGDHGAMWFFSAVSVVGVAFVSLMVPGNKHGKFPYW